MFTQNTSNFISYLTNRGAGVDRVWPQGVTSIRKPKSLSIPNWITELLKGIPGDTPRGKLRKICTDEKLDLMTFGYVKFDSDSRVSEFVLHGLHHRKSFIEDHQVVAKADGITWVRLDFHPDSARGGLLTHPRMHFQINGAQDLRIPPADIFDPLFASHFVHLLYQSFKPLEFEDWVRNTWDEMPQSMAVSYGVLKEMHDKLLTNHKSVDLIGCLSALSAQIMLKINNSVRQVCLSDKWPC